MLNEDEKDGLCSPLEGALRAAVHDIRVDRDLGRSSFCHRSVARRSQSQGGVLSSAATTSNTIAVSHVFPHRSSAGADECCRRRAARHTPNASLPIVPALSMSPRKTLVWYTVGTGPVTYWYSVALWEQEYLPMKGEVPCEACCAQDVCARRCASTTSTDDPIAPRWAQRGRGPSAAQGS